MTQNGESQPRDPLEWGGQPTEHLVVQGVDIPRTYRKRVLLVSPSVDDLGRARQQLLRAGAPGDARVHFVQWNTPPTNYYVVATWQDAPSELPQKPRRGKRRWPSIRGKTEHQQSP